jgi:tetratricopeptide (TPR) repeat protein
MSASVSGRISNSSRRLVVQMLVAALAFALALAMSARAARAAGAAAEPNDAKARYMSGQSHYNLNEFAEALQDFKEAYRLRPDPAFLFNIAQCERQLGNLEEAIKFYRSYLRNKPDAGNKREIEKKIEELKVLTEAKKKATMGAPQSVIPPATVDDQSGRGGGAVLPPPASEPPAVAPAAVPEAPKTTTSTSTSTSTTTTTTTSTPASTPTNASASTGTALAAAEPAPAALGVDLTAHPSETNAGAPPIYKRWYFWAGAGAVVVVLGVVAAVAMSGGSSAPPASGLGNQRVF